MKVLFMCTANSCRSILSEAVFNHLAPVGFVAISSGSFPKGQVLPRSLATLAAAGINTEGLYSKGNDAFEGSPPDLVITVCDKAAGEACLGKTNMPPMANGGMQRGVYGRAEMNILRGILTETQKAARGELLKRKD